MSDNPQEPRAWTTKNLDGSTSENIFWTALDDAVELEPTGQLSIGVDGEQRALEGLAPEGKPAPSTFERDAAEKAAREELEDYAARSWGDSKKQADKMLAAGRPVTIADHGKTLEAGGVGFTIEVPASARARALRDARAAGANLQDRAQAAARTYTCGCCGSSLTADEAIYSRFTGQRYCPPGMCLKDPKGA